jgi:hypothetical protein
MAMRRNIPALNSCVLLQQQVDALFNGIIDQHTWMRATGSLHQRVIRQLDDSRQEVRIANHPAAMALARPVLDKDQLSGSKLPLTVAHFNTELAGQDTEQEALRGVMPTCCPAGRLQHQLDLFSGEPRR